MKKTMLAAACALSLVSLPAFAQSSQGKAGSDNGPSANPAPMNETAPGARGATGTMNTGTGSGMRDGTVGAGTGSSAPSSEGNVGPGTNNNSTKQPGGR
jgi:hypothetical protein